jgi:hypothetical protein
MLKYPQLTQRNLLRFHTGLQQLQNFQLPCPPQMNLQQAGVTQLFSSEMQTTTAVIGTIRCQIWSPTQLCQQKQSVKRVPQSRICKLNQHQIGHHQPLTAILCVATKNEQNKKLKLIFLNSHESQRNRVILQSLKMALCIHRAIFRRGLLIA